MVQQPVLEIGGTHATAAVIDTASHTVVAQSQMPLDSNGSAGEIISRLVEVVQSVSNPGEIPWGVAIPGPFDYQRGIGDFSGVGKFSSLKGVSLRHELEQKLHGVAEQFVFLNDADAFAFGEWEQLPAHTKRAVFLTLGTGIGSSFFSNGRPVTDSEAVPPHGDVHWLSFGGRPLEETVSRKAVIDSYQTQTGQSLDVKEIAELARGGEKIAQEVFDRSYFTLGSCLSPVLARFRTEVVVLGGSISQSWDLVYPAFLRGLSSGQTTPELPEIRKSQTPADSALVGAAIAAQIYGPSS